MTQVRNSLIKNCISIMAVALVLASCNRHTIYSKYHPIGNEGWQREDSIRLEIDNISDSGIYIGTLELRTDMSYPYINLSVAVRQHTQPSGIVRCDTLNLTLSDIDGNTTGEGINHYQHHLVLPSDINLYHGDTLHISINHIMHREVLPGITDVGFTLRKKTYD